MDFSYNGKTFNVRSVSNRIDQKERVLEKQKRILDNLIFADSGMTVFNKTESYIELSKGCQACKNGSWWCLFVGHYCNMNCKFCPQDKSYDSMHAWDHPRTIEKFWIDDVKFYLDKFGDKLTGVSFSGGEPLLYFDKMIEIADYVSRTQKHIYQWTYTNGVYITEERLQKMKDAGIEEVRVDLLATGFSDSVVDKLELVRNIIGKVTVEIPSIKETYVKLVDEGYINRLVDAGVEQLNLAELNLSQDINWETYAYNEDIYIYDSLWPTIYSPVYSRLITVDIIEHVIENKLVILVNDCSNDAKHLQGVMRDANTPLATR